MPIMTRKPEQRRPDRETVYTINTDGSRNFIHPADVKGYWHTRINALWIALLGVFFGLPWVSIDGRPAVLIDLPGHKTYLFGATFTNQDFYLMFFVLTGIGFALFMVTALWGRVWCGFACPQTVFLEGLFRRFERLIEGRRGDRIRRNQGPDTFDKVWRKLVKHSLFILISLLCANAFIAYFVPVQDLIHRIFTASHLGSPAFIWALAWSAILYFNYSWFREQTCQIVCPYGRLQSSLIDSDTVIIGYDEARGEPRGKNSGGDCIDCFRCVDVCPTGIDIRNGLQMECLGCARCIDACNAVMERMGKPRHLVRFDSLRGFAGEKRASWRRPRVLIYIIFMLAGMVISLKVAGNREEFQANILRARGLPFVFEADRIRNLFSLHIQNKSSDTVTYTIAVNAESEPTLEFIIPQTEVTLGSGEDVEVPVFVYLPKASYHDSLPLTFKITDQSSGHLKEVTTLFRGP
jgi:cytochrome c oxidase accessory protein FixG